MRAPGRELEDLLGDALPADHARQTIAEQFIYDGVGRRPDGGGRWRVLDLGCGPGSSVDVFRARDQDVEWVGLDVPGAPEPPTRSDARFETFDGVDIPFPDASFDLVYCKQVLEHVRHPPPLLRSVRRVLAPDGIFAGSTSQLEAYHARSMWNYTPLGFRELLEEAGFALVQMRPGIDGFALVGRRLAPRGRIADRVWARWWATQSPVNRLIDGYARIAGFDVRATNAMKLLFCGQFTFLARRV